MRVRSLVAAAVVIAVSLASAGPILARAAAERWPEMGVDAAGPAIERVRAREEARARRVESRARRDAAFVGSGTATAVPGGSIAVPVEGRTARDLRERTRTFTVAPGARTSRNGQRIALSDIEAGDRAVLKGRRSGAAHTAQVVRGRSSRQERRLVRHLERHLLLREDMIQR